MFVLNGVKDESHENEQNHIFSWDGLFYDKLGNHSHQIRNELQKITFSKYQTEKLDNILSQCIIVVSLISLVAFIFLAVWLGKKRIGTTPRNNSNFSLSRGLTKSENEAGMNFVPKDMQFKSNQALTSDIQSTNYGNSNSGRLKNYVTPTVNCGLGSQRTGTDTESLELFNDIKPDDLSVSQFTLTTTYNSISDTNQALELIINEEWNYL